MSSVHRYIRYAEQCVALAEELHNAAHRSLLLEMAKEWRELAEKLAAHDRPPNKERDRTRG
jgi:predicted secreted protein